MSRVTQPVDYGAPSTRQNRRLDSWKAIAEYLNRHVTTLQRWEHEEGLPVHRHHHERRGSVYAFTDELDAWLVRRSAASAGDTRSRDPRAQAPAGADPSAAFAGPPLGPPPASAGSAEALVGDGPAMVPGPLRMPGAAGTQPTRAGAGRARWLTSRIAPVWAVAAAIVVTLAIVVGLAKDFWPASDEAAPLTIAVLPLKNRSPDAQPDYFVDGMTEALTTDLATLGPVRVIARQSVMQYRDTGKPATTIAKELGVSALVEGAVQQSDGRIRVDIRLVDGATSRLLWATSHEREVGDALALQADVSRAIGNKLHVTLDGWQRDRISGRRPTHPGAWDAYLRARFYWNRRTHQDMERAIEWYERAIALDSSSPLVYVGLADVYATLGPANTPVSELIRRGTLAANRAIALDPTMGEPFAALGKLRAYGLDWQGAEANFRKAIQHAPGYAPARYWFGSFLANQVRCDEALAQAHEAERLDPVSMPGNMVIAGIELKCGRVAAAISRNTTILEFDPTYGQSYESLGRAYLLQGDSASAIGMFQKALALTGGRPTIRAGLAAALGMAGRRDEAESIARGLEAAHAHDKVLASAWSVAIAHAGLQHEDAALTWLEHAYADREEWLETLAVDDRFRNIRRHPRFQRLLTLLNLPSPLPQS